MLIRHRPSWRLSENDVTSETLYRNRRQIMRGAAGLGAAGLLAACDTGLMEEEARAQDVAPGADGPNALEFARSDYRVEDPNTPEEAATTYNNFYEFGTGKGDPARHAHNMTTDPWSVTVDGLAENTGTFAVEDLINFSQLEERIYRLRCVEAWSMVIPWIGVPLASVIEKCQPRSSAKYVAFETYLNRSEMRGVRWPVLDWPYVEGLRMDEAMHPLTLMVVGMYGKVVPNQNGAPMRLIVPWKYGFKSIKSIVRISFVEEQPPTSWNKQAPREYGFFSNVNPNVDHPRWSQASERVIGGSFVLGRRDTEMFNGYAEEVESLYAGMDLREFY